MPSALSPSATQDRDDPSEFISREALLALGRTGDRWRFLGIATRVAPPGADAAVDLLAASAFAALGLRTPAAERLDALPTPIRAEPAAEVLQRAIDGLPSDRVAAGRLRVMCRANLATLRDRGIDLTREFETWSAGLEEVEVFQAADKNVVRRRGRGAGATWLRIADDAGEASRLTLPHRPGVGVEHPEAPSPYSIEGIDPPWLLQRIYALTPPASDGYQPPVTIIQADPLEFLDALSLADLRAELGDQRVRLFVGAGAGERFLADLRARFDQSISGTHFELPALRTRASPCSRDALAAALREQAAEHTRLVLANEERSRSRDRAWRARRLGALTADRPRALIPTCRYTTFVRHSAEDLARELRRAGWDVTVLMEPDRFTRLSSLAYSRAFFEFDPDLTIVINYTRARFGRSIPPGAPFVAWLQDAMGHLFDEQVGAAQTESDFLVGNVPPVLSRRFRYPSERTLSAPVVACESKFHTGPVSDDLRARFDCEIAYVGHQSEPADAFFERQILACGNEPAIREAIIALAEPVRALARDPMAGPIHTGLENMVRQHLSRSLGGAPDGRLVTLVMNRTVLPFADRVLRHQTLEWASQIAARRGWRLHIHGRGWKGHPTLRPHARPEAQHGEELRACYQGARAHLHMSINALAHQRIAECALSGGLPICRLHWDEPLTASYWALGAAERRSVATCCHAELRWPGHHIADHPELLWLTALDQRMGRPSWWVRWAPEADRAIVESRVFDNPSRSAMWLLADPSETAFRDAAELESVLERAITRPRWRQGASHMVRERVRATLTLRRFLTDVLDMVRASLDAETPVRRADGALQTQGAAP